MISRRNIEIVKNNHQNTLLINQLKPKAQGCTYHVCRHSLSVPSSVHLFWLSTFSTNFSWAVRPILFFSHIAYIYRERWGGGGGGNNCVFCSNQKRTLVAMPTNSFH